MARRSAWPAICALLALAALLPACAQQVTEDQARLAAERWVARIVQLDGSWNGSRNPTLGEPVEIVRDGSTVAYSFDVGPSGHVVVTTDFDLPPIKSFSTTEAFRPAARHYYQCVVGDLVAAVQRLGERRAFSTDRGLASVADGNKSAWRLLLEGNRSVGTAATAAGQSVCEAGPLLTTKWDQMYPYNEYCPTVGGRKTLTGCLATALAQIMKYWNHPAAGTGSHCYKWAGGGGGSKRLCADFGHEHRWELMPDQLQAGSSPDSIAAVAQLMYDAGVAVDMDYGVEGSGAYLDPVLTAMPAYFGYSREIVRLWRKNYSSDDAWFAQFATEIDRMRPVLFAIYGDEGGHAAVVDGYRADSGLKFVHINFGWSGACDSYYALNGISAAGYSFNDRRWQAMICGIRPNATDDPTAIEVDGPWADGSIGWPGDENWYCFTVTTAGAYAIETRPGTLSDHSAYLYGPNRRELFIQGSSGDQSGAVSRWLEAGTYFVLVRANTPTAKGTYQIRAITANAIDHIEISGPAALMADDVATYVCTAVYRDGTIAVVTPRWSENSRYASFSADGQLRTWFPPRITKVLVKATYTQGGRTYAASTTAKLYPIGSLRVDGPPVRASIRRSNEVDWHIMSVRAAGAYRISVGGGTLKEAALYIYNADELIAQCVSAGPGDMPSIGMELAKGVYMVGVSGGPRSARGTYKVWATCESNQPVTDEQQASAVGLFE